MHKTTKPITSERRVSRLGAIPPWIQREPWLVSGAFETGNESALPAALNQNSFFFKPDGLVVYITSSFNTYRYIYQIPLSVAWDLSTKSSSGDSVDIYNADGYLNSIYDISFSADGTKMYVISAPYGSLWVCELSSAWDITTAVLTEPKQWTPANNIIGVFFKSDGTRMYYISQGGLIRQVNLAIAWDVSSSGTYVSTYQTQGTLPNIFFSPDGLSLYVVEGYNVHQYNMTSAWDITTASQVSSFYTDLTGAFNDVFFKPDGTRMYILQEYYNRIIQYDLTR